MPTTMKAAVIYQPGGPEVLQLESRPIPIPQPGQVLIRVKAFGLNRSELFTRQGLSPNVKFPRILGIEVVGTVEQAPSGEFAPGTTVASVMGGLGRDFDGSYAEYTVIPAAQVQAIRTQLPWDQLGAVPEMLQTAWGSLFTALKLQKSDSLLIRGGTTSIGLAAAAIAHNFGVEVTSTTRNPDRRQLLNDSGADHVLIDSGSIAIEARQTNPAGYTRVLELIGTTTLKDSLRCAAKGGAVCMTGMVGNQWSIPDFAPMDVIPTAVNLTCYAGESSDFMQMPLESLIQQIAAGTLPVQIGKVFSLDQIVEAHRTMEENKAGGKIVVLP